MNNFNGQFYYKKGEINVNNGKSQMHDSEMTWGRT